ncbi:MAG: hypothetical protein K2Y56_16380 [Methylobacterium sp.]|nr:hypothetical protein [Methylobacterium sp.]MBX9933089.1 hypothetical protein [Methylobacterium sp.]
MRFAGIQASLGTMTDDPIRESRAALILLAVCVLSVLIFGMVTILTQLD